MTTRPTTAAAIFNRPTPAKRVEQGMFWVLRLATYFASYHRDLPTAHIGYQVGINANAIYK